MHDTSDRRGGIDVMRYFRMAFSSRSSYIIHLSTIIFVSDKAQGNINSTLGGETVNGKPAPTRGRGTAENPKNRFATLSYAHEPNGTDPENPSPQTQFFHDISRSIIARNTSPDIGFDASVNPYRGCEHGCIYCYARPTHEYLGFSAGLDFETKILVKTDAPALLRKELRRQNGCRRSSP